MRYSMVASLVEYSLIYRCHLLKLALPSDGNWTVAHRPTNGILMPLSPLIFRNINKSILKLPIRSSDRLHGPGGWIISRISQQHHHSVCWEESVRAKTPRPSYCRSFPCGFSFFHLCFGHDQDGRLSETLRTRSCVTSFSLPSFVDMPTRHVSTQESPILQRRVSSSIQVRFALKDPSFNLDIHPQFKCSAQKPSATGIMSLSRSISSASSELDGHTSFDQWRTPKSYSSVQNICS